MIECLLHIIYRSLSQQLLRFVICEPSQKLWFTSKKIIPLQKNPQQKNIKKRLPQKCDTKIWISCYMTLHHLYCASVHHAFKNPLSPYLSLSFTFWLYKTKTQSSVRACVYVWKRERVLEYFWYYIWECLRQSTERSMFTAKVSKVEKCVIETSAGGSVHSKHLRQENAGARVRERWPSATMETRGSGEVG